MYASSYTSLYQQQWPRGPALLLIANSCWLILFGVCQTDCNFSAMTLSNMTSGDMPCRVSACGISRTSYKRQNQAIGDACALLRTSVGIARSLLQTCAK